MMEIAVVRHIALSEKLERAAEQDLTGGYDGVPGNLSMDISTPVSR